MRYVLFLFFNVWARALAKLSRLSIKLASGWTPSDIQQRNVIRSTRYDMVAAPDEPYYAEQYWSVILPCLEKAPHNAQIIDLGCSQGRFAIRLAKYFNDGFVTGCDISANAVSQARNYAVLDSVENIHFQVHSISDCLGGFSANVADLILLTEVTFFYPQWGEDLPRIIRVLKAGGILVISFRSQYFNALALVRERLFGETESVLQNRQGAIFGATTVFTWQTSAEISSLLVEMYGLELLDLRGIGVCSGIPGDPHDDICQPSQLSDAERIQLMKLELELGKTVPDGGRYILAVARKPETLGQI